MVRIFTHCLFAGILVLVCGAALAQEGRPEAPPPENEEFFFIAPGYSHPGVPSWAKEGGSANLTIQVRDADDGQLTPCRMNVVGSDGNFYQPEKGQLSPYALTGQWPKDSAWGNRRDKAPYRYVGRFFYTAGEIDVAVPPGRVRIEVTKGFEYRPVSETIDIEAGATRRIEIRVRRTVPMRQLGWHSGDPHLHIPRTGDQDDGVIFDLMEAEDIRYASLLGYNEPAGPYAGFMDKFASPQFRGLGRRSILDRRSYHMMSGQEYRTSTYGHLLLYHRDDIVFPGESFDANRWPVYGLIARQTRDLGGYAFYAHGGYRQEIYADAALGAVDGVELLQFGIHREIGLEDWYHMLNTGYRFPCMGASDWPACRTLGDCRTYVYSEDEPDFPSWLAGMAAGRSFVTTGPLLLLEADGHRPGDIARLPDGTKREFAVKIKVACEVTPVRHVDIVVNGAVVKSFTMPDGIPDEESSSGEHPWHEFTASVPISTSSWIAARAWSTTRGGRPDAESHTNPIYIYVGESAPYQRDALDTWVARIDEQIAKQRPRDFPEKARVLDYFQKARDLLLGIRERGGLKADENPSDLAGDLFADLTRSSLRQDASRQDASVAEPSDEQLRTFLKSVPAKPPTEAARALECTPGFEMQLVAAEPLVVDPVAGAFDEDGNLFICEMRDYPFKPAEGKSPRGTVRRLVDSDQDGVFDQSTVFADSLLWAAGVVPWKGGVFVAATPDIWYFKDLDGDGRADERRKIFSGFGEENQQAMVNNLTWGFDHKIYGSTAGNGGGIRRADIPDAPTIDITGRDFRFDPETLEFETITGTVQFGNTFDDWGNRFVCSESQPLQHVVLSQEYLVRNPFLAIPRAIHNIAPGPVPIFRISPIEGWRQIRSSRRIANNERAATSPGASHHVIDAASGVTIYRGGAYPPSYEGTVFVGDGQNNLIHHRRLVPSGVTFASERTLEGTEIARSSDIWFRPVNFINAPDGTLYCLDMSREVLESIHIPLDVVRHLDLASGRDRGRIYRLAPVGFQSPRPPQLSRAEGLDLIEALHSPHGWWRDTAYRLIHERRDGTLVGPLRALSRSGSHARSRLLALGALQGLGQLSDEDLLAALSDSDHAVRASCLRFADSRLDQSPALVEAIIRFEPEDDARLAFQLASTLGQTTDARAAPRLAELLKTHIQDPWIRTAIMSSATPHCHNLLLALLSDDEAARDPQFRGITEQLAMLVGTRNIDEEVGALLAVIAHTSGDRKERATRRVLLLALGNGLARSGGSLKREAQRGAIEAALIDDLLGSAGKDVIDRDQPDAVRIEALGVLRLDDFAITRELCDELLSGDHPSAVRIAAVKVLASYGEADGGLLLLSYWRQYAPEVRVEVARELLARDDYARSFLDAAINGDLPTSEIDSMQRQRLREHRDAAIRQQAHRLWGEPESTPRGAVVQQYVDALRGLHGSIPSGQLLFAKSCSACHQLEKVGTEVGPILSSSAVRDSNVLLTHILDPNRYVPPNYAQYTVVDVRGRVYQGMVMAQTANSISVARERGQTDTLLRTDIDSLVSTGKSLMPEGLERELDPSAMADLVAYLQATVTSPQSDNSTKTRDFGTLPGLVEPK